ncbi:hypothetical protein D3C81_2125400 [compost metagenome]
MRHVVRGAPNGALGTGQQGIKGDRITAVEDSIRVLQKLLLRGEIASAVLDVVEVLQRAQACQ